MRSAVAAALLLTLMACGSADDVTDQTVTQGPAPTIQPTDISTPEDPDESPQTSTDITAVTSNDGDATTTTIINSSATTAPTTTQSSQTGGAALPAMVIAGDGVHVLENGTTFRQVVDGPVAVAVGDGEGGLLFQQAVWADPDGPSTIVYWAPAGAAEPQALLVPSEGQSLRLEDVAVLDGSASVFYTRTEGQVVEDTVQTLRRFDIASRSVAELAATGGWESAAYEISVGGETIATNWSAEAFHGITLRSLDGAPIDMAGELFEEFIDCAICPRNAAITPDGATLYYTQNLFEGGEVTAEQIFSYDLATGAMAVVTTLPGDVWVHSLDAGADAIIVNQWNGDGAGIGPPLVVDPMTGGTERLVRSGIGRLLNTPIELELVQTVER